MAIKINFANEVRDWIADNLGRGVAPQDVARALAANKVEPELAHAMVDAVARALAGEGPMPEGALVVEGPDMDYRPEPLGLPAGSSIRAGGREVRVLARMVRPSVAVLGGMLSASECDQLIAAARPRLQPSLAIDPATGKDTVAGYRSSDGMFFRPRETALVERIERRIAELIGRPMENGEGLQILRYTAGAKVIHQFEPHVDYLPPSNPANHESIARSGQRVSTLIMYLNDVAAGGETAFPGVGLSIVPQKGHAVYFGYVNSLGQADAASLHAGLPVLSGEKWIATKWVRERKFVPKGGFPV